MRLLGFSPKLRLATLWPALIALVTAGVLLWGLLPAVFERGSAVQLLDTLEILSPVVAERLDAAEASAAGPAGAAGDALAAWVRGIARDSHLRITLIRSDGKVIADSARTPEQLAQMENHAGRPEVRGAMAAGQGQAVRTSATTGVTYVYAARTLTGRGGRLYVLRLAQPVSQLQGLRGRLGLAMLLAAAAAALAVLALSLWIDARLFQPLSRLVVGAGELASGRYDYRLAMPDEEELAALGLALNRLAATVQGQVAALGNERDHLQAILAGMSEGVLVVGGDGRALLANPAFRRLFDLERDRQVAGRPLLEIVRQPELARLVDDTLRLGRAGSVEIEVQAPERRSLHLASAALDAVGEGDAPGAMRERRAPAGSAVVVARDTTEFTRLIEMRRDFVANVSHELKTPLSAIRGYAETLRDGALAEPATAGRFTERILFQCRRLQALLDDLLTLSRLESLEHSPEREPVDLNDLVQRAVELLAPAAAEKGVEVELAAGERPVPPLPGDPEGLERLVVNLLDNAVKYNHPGGKVFLRLAERDGAAVLEVEDTGIGIPQEALPRIFERFYRVDKGRAREEGGTGLGLAIVKHVAQIHGGQVEVESGGRGSTFRVRLPLPPGPAVAA
ncbi:MAG TPA: ATP-binding protein [Thermoanaerobaculia bacterium]|nr:ATP-binding protein [Thermoanaerobaculia bacterium]